MLILPHRGPLKSFSIRCNGVKGKGQHYLGFATAAAAAAISILSKAVMLSK